MQEILNREVRFKPSKPQFDIITSRKQVNLFMAGQGSGKTMAAGIIAGTLIQQFPKVHGFIGANTYQQLSDSTLFRIRKVWKEYFGWSEWTKENPRGQYVVDSIPPPHFNTEDQEYDTYRGKICFKWGTVVYKGSLDNYKAHEGKEFAWAVLDETKDTAEAAVKEVITGRLREPGMYVNSGGELVDNTRIEKDKKEKVPDVYKSFNPLYIFTSPAKVQWINEWFFLDVYATEITEKIYLEDEYFLKDIGNKRATISSVYHNKENLPESFIDNQKQNLNSGQQDMLIFANPFSNTGGEFYKCFVRAKHVIDVRTIYGFNDGKRAYNPALALHVTFDFNVNPYISCTIWQIEIKEDADGVKTKYVYQIDEICLENPRNTTSAACLELVRRYQGHQAGMFVYGDATGKHEDTRTEKGYNDFLIIMRALSKFKPSQRVPAANPPVVMRGNFINTILEKGYEGIQIFIHETCVKSINDYTYLKEDSDGTKKKEKVKNEDTGVTYEKYGHTSDSGDYFLCMAFSNEYNKYKAGGTVSAKPTLGQKPVSPNTY